MASPRKAAERALMADVSSNNGQVNVGQYASAGHLILAVKATEGTTYVNPLHAVQAHGMHGHRRVVLHYHFARPDSQEPEAEAEHFWATVRPYFRKGDRLAVDLEVGEQAGWPGWLRRFDARLIQMSGVECIGYTFASADLNACRLRSGKWWLASWGSRQPSGAFRKLPGGQTLWAWQYTDGAVDPSGGPTHAAGIAGACDMSVLAPPIVKLIAKDLGL